ncbi:MAG: 4'-phosphopantetheinyl transferase superfamily protein [Holosporaceae bacterium]|jgi:4'-phosphopantetheinyl transferase EntD|nr:4'-phosphopantetheinyl transferase superfamily protein [Holosporaceae bacterium]
MKDIAFPFRMASCCNSTAFGYDFGNNGLLEKLSVDYGSVPGFCNFCNKRKIEFLAGRYCSVKSIGDLIENTCNEVIGINADRTPRWPRGIVGSITHTKGFASAAVAFQKNVLGVGIDVEIILSEEKAKNLKDGILNKVERDNFLYTKSEITFNTLCTIVFSAKESIFKCIYPLIRRYFDISEVEIFAIDLSINQFKFRLPKEMKNVFTSPDCVGCVSIDGQYVYTAVELLKN